MTAWERGTGFQVFGQRKREPGLCNHHSEELKPAWACRLSWKDKEPRKGVGASELNLPSYIQGPAKSHLATEDRSKAPFIGRSDSTTDVGPGA